MRGNPFSMHQPDALEEQQLRNQEVRLYQAVDRLTALVTVLQKRPAEEGLSECLRSQLQKWAPAEAAGAASSAQEGFQLVQLTLESLVCPALQEIHVAVTDVEFNDPATAAAREISRNPEQRPAHAPRGMLSVVHMRYLYTALELVWCWGVVPTVQAVAPQPKQVLPKSILLPAATFTTAEATTATVNSQQLANYVDHMARITLMPRFMPLLLDRYLGKMMLACVLLSRELLPSPTAATAECGCAALDWLLEAVPSPTVIAAVKHLLMGAGKYPAIVRNDISGMMTKMLLQRGGLATVIDVYLGGIGGISDENSKANVFMAKTLAAVPASMSAEMYYENLGAQILELLQTETRAEGFKARVVSLLVARMCAIHPKEADEKVLQPALQPFLAHEAAEDREEVARTEEEVSMLVCNTHTILLSMPASAPILQAVEANGTMRSVFEVFCCAWRTKSAVLNATEEILRAYLTNAQTSVAALALYALYPPHTVEAVLGGSGGVQVRKAQAAGAATTVDDMSLNLGMLRELSSLLGEGESVDSTAFAAVLGSQIEEDSAGVSGAALLARRMGEVKKRFEGLVALVQNLSSVASQFFVHLLRSYMEDESVAVGRRLSLSVGLLVTVEALGPAALETGLQILQVLNAFLRWGVQQMNVTLRDAEAATDEPRIDDSAEFDVELLVTILGLLTTILELGNTQRPPEEETEFRSMLEPLETLSKTSNAQVADMSVSVRLSIMTRSLDLNERSKAAASREDVDPEQKVLRTVQEAEADLQSPHPALRARGVVTISRVVRRIGKITSEDVIDSVESVLINMLGDAESYVYLAAVQALATLSNATPSIMIPRLTKWFVDAGVDKDGGQPPQITLDQRAKIGEALLFAVKRAGETMPKYCGMIVYALLRNCRQRLLPESGQQRLDEPARSLAEEHEEGAETKQVASDWAAYYQTMDLIHFRTGCISILAEVIGAASWAAAPYIRDVFDLAFGVLIFESSLRKDHIHARRAAAYLLFECMNRLRETLFQIAHDQLLEYYRWLKQLSSDPDNVVAFHAQRALGEMDTVVRGQLFPDPKNRNEELTIRIL